MQTETVVKRPSKKANPQTAKSEVEMTQGQPVYKGDPNKLTIVKKGHPLYDVLYFPRNDTKYEANSPSVNEFKRQGQMQAVGTFPYTNPLTGQRELVVAFGNQRVLKARAAGIDVSFVIFKDWTPTDAFDASLAENEQRQNLTFKEQLMAVRRLVKLKRDAGIKSPFAEIASRFGRSSHQWARDMYAVSMLPAEILKKVPDIIPFATAIQITKAEKSEGQTLEQAQIALFNELMEDETNLSQKKGVSVERAASTRAKKDPVDKLSPAELRVLIANEDLDLSLSDEDTRIVISAILGDKDLKEVKRAGIDWYTHPEKKSAKGKDKAKGKNKPVKETKIEDVEFESDDEEDLDLPFDESEDDE